MTKRGHFWWYIFKWPLICEAFNGHFGNKQTHCKLLRNTLVTARHCKLRNSLITSMLNLLRSTMILIQIMHSWTAQNSNLECMLSNLQLGQPWSFYSVYTSYHFTLLSCAVVDCIYVVYMRVMRTYSPLSHCTEFQDRAIGSISGVHWGSRGWECMHCYRSLAVSSVTEHRCYS